ncbi:MAG TPA: hypothetical protein VKB20_06150, partial [Steroidobacteraceae bacterium]|nr:hypothetical protein [Steroidobacteraceae bacterium]
MRLLFWIPLLLALVACAAKPVEETSVPVKTDSAAPAVASATAAPSGAAAAAAPAKAAIGDFGLDLSARNPAVKPGDDFFGYANGRWYDGFVIPADKSSFGPFDRLDELSKQRVRGIIE